MAITQNTAVQETFANQSSHSYATIVDVGDNIVAMIGLSWAPLIEALTGTVTFAGQTATFLQLVSNVAGVSEQYYVKGVLPGARTVAVTWDDGNVNGLVGLEIMNGVDQTSPIGVKNTASAAASSPATVTLSGTTSGNWVVDNLLVQRQAVTSVTPDPSMTPRWNTIIGAGLTAMIGACSTKESSGGAQTMQYTISPIRRWAICATEFRAAATTPPVSLGGYTSYDYPADPLPLESMRSPEEQQRVWVNDRRYMQERP